ncbi:MAG: DNA mismatch repair protein MutS [Ruminococcaceae bacterium]|nr:DNA mismatch repair protein MutS [Oscillospiraceae bacterium]
MMLQYFEIKKEYQDYLLFYRLGDFYEMFFDDAKIASRELDLTLTGRDCGEDERAPMCGVPFHSCDGYIAKLVEKGYKVAICEQTQDPATCKGIVPREVIRIITPGTVTLGDALEEGKNNFLATVCIDGTNAACAFYDISDSTMYAIALEDNDRAALERRIINEFAKFDPKEMIVNLPEEECATLAAFMKQTEGNLADCGMYDLFEEKNVSALKRHFGKSVAELGLATEASTLARACGALITYLSVTQKTSLTSLAQLKIYDNNESLSIDSNSRRNLELVESARGKEKRGSLLWVLDKTRTAGGARLLRRFIEQPLTHPRAIAKRQSAVLEFYNDMMLKDKARDTLSPMQDIERILSRIIYSGGNAKDLYALANTLSYLPAVASVIENCTGEELSELYQRLKEDVLPVTDPLCELLLRAIRPDPPFSIREGGFIQKGYNDELDELNAIMTESQSYLAKIEATERELTGIPKLKIGYNRVFGYYFEVSRLHSDQVPERYIRKQTLTNAERYITSELKDMESRILGAKDRAVALEYDLFCELCDKVKSAAPFLQDAAKLVASVDVFASLAHVALENNYVCPVVDYSDRIEIRDGRHPVVEKVTKGFFVPNDALLDTTANRMAIITGPNMAGKSTYMRGCAIIVIMAQMGSFVPAKEAHIGIVDKIFTRIGASDDLSMGQSTFMLEMSEVAYILQNATKKSLIIYDEIGRGTSTYDGMSIARAVVEYTAGKKCGAKTLFATHYHELSELENTMEGVKNYNIAAKKRGDSIIFLRKILPGSADESYGIEVANLAGVPNEVIRRAKETLKELEAKNPKEKKAAAQEEELPIFASLKDEIIDSLRGINVDTMSPIEALSKLYELSQEAKKL